MSKYIFKGVVDREDATIYTEIGKTPKGLIVFSLEPRPGKENVTCINPAIVTRDMIEYTEPRKGTLWLNIYSPTEAFVHYSKPSEAKHSGGIKPIAQIEVPWVEGQGLTKECGCKISDVCCRHCK